ncbi:MAG: hypothetical protein LBR21_01760 [Propionibacteriaceae bacterium]|jgi:hypothetical protein|nr:hypothetical protein [Propionibacteriaceae bacterium]
MLDDLVHLLSDIGVLGQIGSGGVPVIKSDLSQDEHEALHRLAQASESEKNTNTRSGQLSSDDLQAKTPDTDQSRA